MENNTLIHAATASIERSKCFYERLKFEVVSETEPFIVSDGKAFIEINPARSARNGIKVYGADISKIKANLDGISAVIKTEEGLLASDPNGVRVYLSAEPVKFDLTPKANSVGLVGHFEGLSIEAHDFLATVRFWEAIGFKQTKGDVAHGFVEVSNGSALGISIMKSLMCPHLFVNPSLTFFNGGKNLTTIGLLREEGIRFFEEITVFNDDNVVDNVSLLDPGCLGFFIFND
ncbi:MAG: hypothetical protein ACK5NT_14470 [Pyrinomonadaceae bacterium]